MHDVSNAINILDPSNTIDAKFECYKDADGRDISSEKGECAAKNGGSSAKKLSEAFDGTDGQNRFDEKTAKNISNKATKALNREQKGVVSSAFKGC